MCYMTLNVSWLLVQEVLYILETGEYAQTSVGVREKSKGQYAVSGSCVNSSLNNCLLQTRYIK